MKGRTALHAAAEIGSLEIVMYLVEVSPLERDVKDKV